MAITRFLIENFRNLISVNCNFLPQGFNFIYGQNGSGKTSLIESIYFLSLGRSFRCSSPEKIIHYQADKASLFADVLYQNINTSIGVERKKDKSSKIRLSGKDQPTIAELTRLLPLKLICAQNYSLLDGGPLFRRKYLDWGAFYFKKEFLSAWQKLDKALKQRNAALRSRLPRAEIEIWTNELVESAQLYHQIREEYVELLKPQLITFLSELIPYPIEILYYPGWDSTQEYARLLADNYYKDLQLGFTQLGPHKADLKLLINQVLAKDFLSRGQQKLFICGMILAQGKLLQELTDKRSIYLVDDLASELDGDSLEKVIALLAEQNTQVFLTAISEEVKGVLKGPSKMFHVKHGALE